MEKTSEENNPIWTVRAILKWTVEKFRSKGIENPRLESEIFIAKALGTDRVGVYLNMERPLSNSERLDLRSMVARRLKFEPLAYIIGEKEFYGYTFEVDKNVLIPRPDTESLIEEIRSYFKDEDFRLLDVGCGSGAICVTCALLFPNAHIVGLDKSKAALEISRRNASKHQVDIEFVESDLFENAGNRQFDIIVSNPPYVGLNEEIGEEVKWEPSLALYAGEDGFSVISRLIKDAPGFLVKNGILLIETGYTQTGETARLMESDFYDIKAGRDLAGNPRYVTGKLKK